MVELPAVYLLMLRSYKYLMSTHVRGQLHGLPAPGMRIVGSMVRRNRDGAAMRNETRRGKEK
jgi:hypothetical protein